MQDCGGACNCDKLKIEDMYSTYFCGNIIPDEVHWDTNEGPLIVKFQSDQGVVRRGFRLDIIEIGGPVTTPVTRTHVNCLFFIISIKFFCLFKLTFPICLLLL